jgi:hypothetical protein
MRPYDIGYMLYMNVGEVATHSGGLSVSTEDQDCSSGLLFDESTKT